MPLLLLGFFVFEVWLLIEVGSEIGGLSVFGWVLISFALGLNLIKQQGFDTLVNAQQNLSKVNAPLPEMFKGICKILAGIFLIVPGFITDILGVLLLVPVVQTWIITRLSNNAAMFKSANFSAGFSFNKSKSHHKRKDDNVVEGEYTVINEDDKKIK